MVLLFHTTACFISLEALIDADSIKSLEGKPRFCLHLDNEDAETVEIKIDAPISFMLFLSWTPLTFEGEASSGELLPHPISKNSNKFNSIYLIKLITSPFKSLF